MHLEIDYAVDHRSVWSDGWSLRLDQTEHRGVLWCRRGLTESLNRAFQGRSVGFIEWSACVEGVWWAVALDDVLFSLHRDSSAGVNRYLLARAEDENGETVVGLRWLRHQHAHRIVVTGEGGPKRDFFAPEAGGMFYISPDNRWLPRSDISTGDRKLDRVSEAAYDARVAKWPLQEPLRSALRWFDCVLSAGGVDPLGAVDREDPSML